MRPWASVRCKSQPSPFRAIHCDVWPPRAIQLFVSFRDRSPVTIKLASHPGQPYAVKPRPPGPARLRSSLPHCVPLLFAWHLCSLHIGSSLRLALQFFALRLNRPPVTIKPATPCSPALRGQGELQPMRRVSTYCAPKPCKVTPLHVPHCRSIVRRSRINRPSTPSAGA